MHMNFVAKSCCTPLLHWICAPHPTKPLQSSELQDPISIAWRLIHPHLLRAIVHNRIREQPLLGSTAPINALHPIVAATNHCDTIQEDPIDVLGRWGLTQQHDIIVGLEDRFVVVDAIAADLIEDDRLVLLSVEVF